MHDAAKQLNARLEKSAPEVLSMLSELGQALYFPKEGILNQSAEAKAKANRFNATIGIALEDGVPMHLDVIQSHLTDFSPNDLYNYAPPAGKPELRSVWRDKLLEENPSMQGKRFGNPIVTNALTHGLSIVADLFADAGDAVILPDKNWENYELTFGVRRGARMETYPLYDETGAFNAAGLEQAILNQRNRGKAIVLLNFPNNPTGYTPSVEEGNAIVRAIENGAKAGVNVVAVTDDAYFFLFFEESLKESLFGKLCGVHPRVLPVKVDGATKEEFVWGFRVGFLTFGAESDEALAVLEQKAMGIIRATISSGSHPSQTFVLKALKAADFKAQKLEKFEIMKGRANRVKAVLDSGRYDDAWHYYPFNSGYFMCLELKRVNAEDLRTALLERQGIGTIALGERDLRIAFSCIEERDIENLFQAIYDTEQALVEGR